MKNKRYFCGLFFMTGILAGMQTNKETMAASPVIIDGDYSDWADAEIVTGEYFTNFGVKVDDQKLYLYGKGRGDSSYSAIRETMPKLSFEGGSSLTLTLRPSKDASTILVGTDDFSKDYQVSTGILNASENEWEVAIDLEEVSVTKDILFVQIETGGETSQVFVPKKADGSVEHQVSDDETTKNKEAGENITSQALGDTITIDGDYSDWEDKPYILDGDDSVDSIVTMSTKTINHTETQTVTKWVYETVSRYDSSLTYYTISYDFNPWGSYYNDQELENLALLLNQVDERCEDNSQYMTYYENYYLNYYHAKIVSKNKFRSGNKYLVKKEVTEEVTGEILVEDEVSGVNSSWNRRDKSDTDQLSVLMDQDGNVYFHGCRIYHSSARGKRSGSYECIYYITINGKTIALHVCATDSYGNEACVTSQIFQSFRGTSSTYNMNVYQFLSENISSVTEDNVKFLSGCSGKISIHKNSYYSAYGVYEFEVKIPAEVIEKLFAVEAKDVKQVKIHDDGIFKDGMIYTQTPTGYVLGVAMMGACVLAGGLYLRKKKKSVVRN